MPFIEFSTAFSFDFGLRRKDMISLDDLEIVESEAESELANQKDRTPIGFQPNPEE